jgi:hypothetical protein
VGGFGSFGVPATLISMITALLGAVSGAMSFLPGTMVCSLRVVRRIESLGPFLGDDAILILLVLPRVAFTRAEGQGKGGNQEAQIFHRAPLVAIAAPLASQNSARDRGPPE